MKSFLILLCVLLHFLLCVLGEHRLRVHSLDGVGTSTPEPISLPQPSIPRLGVDNIRRINQGNRGTCWLAASLNLLRGFGLDIPMYVYSDIDTLSMLISEGQLEAVKFGQKKGNGEGFEFSDNALLNSASLSLDPKHLQMAGFSLYIKQYFEQLQAAGRYVINSDPETYQCHFKAAKEGWDKLTQAEKEEYNARAFKVPRFFAEPLAKVFPSGKGIQCSDGSSPFTFLQHVFPSLNIDFSLVRVQYVGISARLLNSYGEYESAFHDPLFANVKYELSKPSSRFVRQVDVDLIPAIQGIQTPELAVMFFLKQFNLWQAMQNKWRNTASVLPVGTLVLDNLKNDKQSVRHAVVFWLEGKDFFYLNSWPDSTKQPLAGILHDKEIGELYGHKMRVVGFSLFATNIRFGSGSASEVITIADPDCAVINIPGTFLEPENAPNSALSTAMHTVFEYARSARNYF